jgi:hypothetical protein
MRHTVWNALNARAWGTEVAPEAADPHGDDPPRHRRTGCCDPELPDALGRRPGRRSSQQHHWARHRRTDGSRYNRQGGCRRRAARDRERAVARHVPSSQPRGTGPLLRGVALVRRRQRRAIFEAPIRCPRSHAAGRLHPHMRHHRWRGVTASGLRLTVALDHGRAAKTWATAPRLKAVVLTGSMVSGIVKSRSPEPRMTG